MDKKPFMKTLMSNMTGRDVDKPGEFIKEEIVFPAVKSLAADATELVFRIVQGMIETYLFGAPRNKRVGKTGYASYYKRDKESAKPNAAKRIAANTSIEERVIAQRAAKYHVKTVGYDVKVCMYDTHDQAREIIDTLRELIEENGCVSVSEYYALVGQGSTPTDNHWGWISLDGSIDTKNTGAEGWRIFLPKPIPI